MSAPPTSTRRTASGRSNGKWGRLGVAEQRAVHDPPARALPDATRPSSTAPSSSSGSTTPPAVTRTRSGRRSTTKLIQQGYAYVGVTAQRAGMKDLVRPGTRSATAASATATTASPTEIFTQAAEVVKADSATLLGGLTPKKLIGTGDSQSAFRVDTYVNAIQPLTACLQRLRRRRPRRHGGADRRTG